MKRILFLDVDGVLNNGKWASEMYEIGVHVYREDLLYEPALIRLQRIVSLTGALIVVSSAWRQIPSSYERLREWLNQYGMSVYDRTPYVGGCRGDDITAWFNRHPDEVYRYVILDDDDDMGIHLSHLIQTDFDEGLTDGDATRAIEILLSPCPDDCMR